jgi:glycosyltransferase involved in cell wall biosynthesis
MPYPQNVHDLLNRTGADSVYMFLHPGWSSEARANRWHMATRWARHLPTTLVVPEKGLLNRAVVVESRIPNCRVLRVSANPGPLWGVPAQLQAAAVLQDTRRVGAKRPILWIYNAEFLETFATIPAAARVHHVTENYFDFGTLPPDYLERVRLVAELSDLNVAVSDGCARPLRAHADSARLVVATNGCDFATFGAAVTPDAEVTSLRRSMERLAVFGGNINDRLDLELVDRAAAANPRTMILFVGAQRLSAPLATRFRELLARQNVRHLGAVDPDRLPAIYRAADFGFIPYTRVPMITENGFPLKVFEMAATGLPVVSTLMKPLKPIAPPLNVADDDAAFLRAFSSAGRTPALESELRTLAARNDYDLRFDDIARDLAMAAPRAGTRLADLPAPIAGTESVVLDTIVRQRWSAPLLYWRFRIEVLGRLASLVDRLPLPLRERVVRVKRAFIAPSKAAG